jgi:two-component system, LuxR family, response regulator FixJ
MEPCTQHRFHRYTEGITVNVKAETNDIMGGSMKYAGNLLPQADVFHKGDYGHVRLLKSEWPSPAQSNSIFLHRHLSEALAPDKAAHDDPIEKPPSHGLLHIYLIDADDDRRASVHRMFSGRSNMVIRVYRSRATFMAEAEMLDEGCVVLCDHGGEEQGDVSGFIRLLDASQRFACVMLATQQDIRIAIEAMKAGAVDCLLYPCDESEILACVHGALDAVRQVVAHNAGLIEARQQIDRLTAREKDVLHGLMHGKSNKMIALDLAISPRTVEIYRAHLMEKLGAHSLSETLKVAFAAGLG